MLLRLVSPVKRPGSSIPQFIKRVPIEIRDQMIGRKLLIPLGDGTVSATVDKQGVIRFSLGTRDPSEAKGRQADALAYLERVFEAERHNRPIELSRRLAVALAGILYRAWIEGEDREQTIAWQHGPNGWERVYDGDADGSEEAAGFRAVAAQMVALGDGADVAALERVLGPVVDVVGARPDVMMPRLTPGSRATVLVEFARAVRDMAERRARQAEGDYSPDPNSERFPEWQRPVGGNVEESDAPSSSKVSLTGLVDDWWKEQERVGKAKSTYVNYRGVFGRLVTFLKLDKARRATADDARRLTAEDVVRFKDHRLAEGMSPRTVNDNDLAAMRSVLAWALTNKKLLANVAEGIKVIGAKKEKRRGFTDNEAKAILRAAQAVELDGQEYAETLRALRWGPWLMAYTGARVGEIGQLRKEDVAKVTEDGEEHWSITITPEAGTVKGGKTRKVPLHPHLVAMGFVDMVERAPAGHLFLRPNGKTGDVLGPLQGVKNRLAEAARLVVPDKGVSPNHGWRHWFITQCRKVGVSQELRRMITGHSGEGVDEQDYGEAAGLFEEICKLPVIKTD